MSMKEIVEKLNAEILNGLTFTNPGATEMARREPFYCSQMTVKNCRDCSLVNYDRDCHNNPLDCAADTIYPTGKVEE